MIKTAMLHGFGVELLKLAGMAQNQQTDGAIPAQGVDAALSKSLGASAKAGLKTPGGNEQQMAPRPPAPYPVTTPTRMTG